MGADFVIWGGALCDMACGVNCYGLSLPSMFREAVLPIAMRFSLTMAPVGQCKRLGFTIREIMLLRLATL